VEKYPEAFDIDMIRCIFCGMCEEVCPEQAIFLRKDYAITGFTRADMVHHKEKLLEIGGVMHGVVLKWNKKKRTAEFEIRRSKFETKLMSPFLFWIFALLTLIFGAAVVIN